VNGGQHPPIEKLRATVARSSALRADLEWRLVHDDSIPDDVREATGFASAICAALEQLQLSQAEQWEALAQLSDLICNGLEGKL
jgi:hypothetical protein